jgi:hypothetical protein
VVFGAVGINAIIGFIQEYRAGKAIEALSAMLPEVATVLRDGHSQTVPAGTLAPLDARSWLLAMGVGAVVLPVISLDKWLRNHGNQRGERGKKN